jgi:hypothetical protein
MRQHNNRVTALAELAGNRAPHETCAARDGNGAPL